MIWKLSLIWKFSLINQWILFSQTAYIRLTRIRHLNVERGFENTHWISYDGLFHQHPLFLNKRRAPIFTLFQERVHPSWRDSWRNSHLVKWVDSWWNRKNLGEKDWLLVKWVDSWWNQKYLGEIIFRQDKTNFSVCLKERRIIDIFHHVLIGQTCYL